MNNENQIKIGLWKKVSASGNEYFNGKATINGKEYWVKMFDNSSKTNPNAPDFNILLDEVVERTESTVKPSPAQADGEVKW